MTESCKAHQMSDMMYKQYNLCYVVLSTDTMSLIPHTISESITKKTYSETTEKNLAMNTKPVKFYQSEKCIIVPSLHAATETLFLKIYKYIITIIIIIIKSTYM